MSYFWNNILTTTLATVAVVMAIGLFGLAGRAAIFVDMSQAIYKTGEMVEFRCGDNGGQVTGVYGTNNGLIHLVPTFKYRARYNTAAGVKSTTFEPWELDEIDD